MILPDQTLIRTGALAELLGVHPVTVQRWTVNDVRLRRCLFRRSYYSVAKLREAGLIDAAATPTANGEGVVDVG